MRKSQFAGVSGSASGQSGDLGLSQNFDNSGDGLNIGKIRSKNSKVSDGSSDPNQSSMPPRNKDLDSGRQGNHVMINGKKMRRNNSLGGINEESSGSGLNKERPLEGARGNAVSKKSAKKSNFAALSQ